MPEPQPLIEIDRVSFGYDTSRMVLHDVSLRFARGQVTAILGAGLTLNAIVEEDRVAVWTALTDGGVKMGIPRVLAAKLATSRLGSIATRLAASACDKAASGFTVRTALLDCAGLLPLLALAIVRLLKKGSPPVWKVGDGGSSSC